MRRFAFVLSAALLLVSASFAGQGQSAPPPQTATPTPVPPPVQEKQVTATVTGRSGVVVMDRPATGRSGMPTERIALANFIAPAGPTSWQNVKLDVKISDSLNTDTQHSKTMTVLCLDGNSSQVRSQSGDGLINIDARPAIRPDGRIYLQLILEYRPDFGGSAASLPSGSSGPGGTTRGTAGFSESLNLLVVDGKPIVASQSADPRSDRKVTVEVTATVVK
jgi:hypothetical protein